MGWRACIALALGIACGSDAETQDSNKLLQELNAARQIVRSHVHGLYDDTPDGTPASQDAVAREWALLADLVAANLDAHADPEKNTAVSGLRIQVAALTSGMSLASTYLDGIGTVFLLKRVNGRYRSVWSIHDLPERQLRDHPLLRAYGTAAATHACDITRKKYDSQLCGPMTADIQSLGPDDRGKLRFSIDGYYSTQQGNDVGYVLSIWQWDGNAAMPLLVAIHGQTFEMSARPTFNPPFLSLHEKDEFQTFYVTAPGAGRQMTWTILLQRDGIRDLGKRSEVRELDTVDDLFARVLKGLPTDEIAAPDAKAQLKMDLGVEGVAIDRGKKADISAALGELMDGEVSRKGSNAELCFNADEVGAFRFVLEPRKGGYFVSKVTKLADLPSRADPCTPRKS